MKEELELYKKALEEVAKHPMGDVIYKGTSCKMIARVALKEGKKLNGKEIQN